MNDQAGRGNFPVPLFRFTINKAVKHLFLLLMAEHMITTEKAKPGCDNNDHILLYQHADHNSYPNAENHQSQKSSHNSYPHLMVS